MNVERNRRRVQALQAVADPVRLAVLDVLVDADLSPSVLAAELGVAPNLLAHHLRVLTEAGVIRRSASEADRRRHYVHLIEGSLDGLLPSTPTTRIVSRVVFVCTHNSARSQLATAVWESHSDVPVASGGTHPAQQVHPGAVAVAQRHGHRIVDAQPQQVRDVLSPDDLVVSVCDAAHEELEDSGRDHMHWSIPDPVRGGTEEAFEAAYETVAGRVVRLAKATTKGTAA